MNMLRAQLDKCKKIGARTLSTATFSIMTLSRTTLNTTTFSIMTLSKTTLSITALVNVMLSVIDVESRK
jgi:hypothetical protein